MAQDIDTRNLEAEEPHLPERPSPERDSLVRQHPSYSIGLVCFLPNYYFV